MKVSGKTDPRVGRVRVVYTDSNVRPHDLPVDFARFAGERLNVIVHHEGDLLRGPRLPHTADEALLRRSFFTHRRTEPADTPVDQG